METNNQQNLNPQQPPTNSIPPIPAKKLSTIIIVVITFVLVVGVVIWFALIQQAKEDSAITNPQSKTDLTKNESQTSLQPEIVNLPAGNTVIYSKQISQQEANGRYWPTESILRKVNDQTPELLATVGKVGEYPIDFVLTPDKKFLLINLESKLQILDLANKELKDLIIAKEQILALAFSPDKTQLFIWDQKFYGLKQYYVRIYDLNTKTEKTAVPGQYEGEFRGVFNRATWRDDNKILLAESWGEYAKAWYYDLNLNKLVLTPGELQYGFVSNDAKLMAIPNSSVNDICDERSGSTVSTYRIVEPITGQEYAKVGDSTKASFVLAFSPDNKQILYSTALTVKTGKDGLYSKDCEKEQPVSYFIYDIATASFKPTNNYQDIMAKWKQDNNWVVEYNPSSTYPEVINIKLNGKIVANFPSENIRVHSVY